MSASLKRLEKIEAALEQLLAKDKAYLLCYNGNDMEAEIQWHIDVGKYDPATQEAVIIMAWGPRPRPDPKTYRKGWTVGAASRSQAQSGRRDHRGDQRAAQVWWP